MTSSTVLPLNDQSLTARLPSTLYDFFLVDGEEGHHKAKIRVPNLSAGAQERQLHRDKSNIPKKRAMTAGFTRPYPLAEVVNINDPLPTPIQEIVPIKEVHIKTNLKKVASSSSMKPSKFSLHSKPRVFGSFSALSSSKSKISSSSQKLKPSTGLSLYSLNENTNDIAVNMRRKGSLTTSSTLETRSKQQPSSVTSSLDSLKLATATKARRFPASRKEDSLGLIDEMEEIETSTAFPGTIKEASMENFPETKSNSRYSLISISKTSVTTDERPSSERISGAQIKRKGKGSKLLRVQVDPLEQALRTKDHLLVENILKVLRKEGLSLERKVVENGIEHPLNLSKPALRVSDDVSSSNFEEAITRSNQKRIANKEKKEVFKRSVSTKILHVSALVREPKETFHRKSKFDVEPTKTVKAKTNSWWSKKEYQTFHDGIAVFRLQKTKDSHVPKPVVFRPTGKLYSAASTIRGSSIIQTKPTTAETSITLRTRWSSLSGRGNSHNLKNSPSLFADDLFKQRSISRQSINSHASGSITFHSTGINNNLMISLDFV